ncbi:MAG: rhodanese-like domain-containing protein [Rhodospirillales bacterium]|nr:rhodanese-like domain-containing protein [Rhodospirillales bacterium]
MHLKKGYKALLEEAGRRVTTVPLAEARALWERPDVQFVDLRDVRELEREGMIPGAFHAPRGMLEFWIDPESPYYKDVFGSGKTFVFYCQSAWRSALATLAVQEMGLAPVCHLEGGFRAWKDAGLPTAERPPHHPRK